jgi:hypothetical protein
MSSGRLLHSQTGYKFINGKQTRVNYRWAIESIAHLAEEASLLDRDLEPRALKRGSGTGPI